MLFNIKLNEMLKPIRRVKIDANGSPRRGILRVSMCVQHTNPDCEVEN